MVDRLRRLPSGYIRYGGIHGQNVAFKWLNEGFSWNIHIFLFFLDGIQWNLYEKWGSHVFFGVRTWNLYWFHWNRGFLVVLEALHPDGGPRAHPGAGRHPGVRPPTPPQVSNSYSKKYVKPPFFRPSLTETVKKKNEGFPLKTIIIVIFRLNFGYETTHLL